MDAYLDAYWSYLGYHAGATVIFFFVGRALRRNIGAKSEGRRIHGRYVFWWAIGAFAVGGAVGPLLVRGDLPNGGTGIAMFCMLAGWLVGTLHGAVVLALRRSEGRL